jgi:hypothetical protein
VGKIPNLFLQVILSFENLSSGENRATHTLVGKIKNQGQKEIKSHLDGQKLLEFQLVSLSSKYRLSYHFRQCNTSNAFSSTSSLRIRTTVDR